MTPPDWIIGIGATLAATVILFAASIIVGAGLEAGRLIISPSHDPTRITTEQIIHLPESDDSQEGNNRI